MRKNLLIQKPKAQERLRLVCDNDTIFTSEQGLAGIVKVSQHDSALLLEFDNKGVVEIENFFTVIATNTQKLAMTSILGEELYTQIMSLAEEALQRTVRYHSYEEASLLDGLDLTGGLALSHQAIQGNAIDQEDNSALLETESTELVSQNDAEPTRPWQSPSTPLPSTPDTPTTPETIPPNSPNDPEIPVPNTPETPEQPSVPTLPTTPSTDEPTPGTPSTPDPTPETPETPPTPTPPTDPTTPTVETPTITIISEASTVAESSIQTSTSSSSGQTTALITFTRTTNSNVTDDSGTDGNTDAEHNNDSAASSTGISDKVTGLLKIDPKGYTELVFGYSDKDGNPAETSFTLTEEGLIATEGTTYDAVIKLTTRYGTLELSNDESGEGIRYTYTLTDPFSHQYDENGTNNGELNESSSVYTTPNHAEDFTVTLEANKEEEEDNASVSEIQKNFGIDIIDDVPVLSSKFPTTLDTKHEHTEMDANTILSDDHSGFSFVAGTYSEDGFEHIDDYFENVDDYYLDTPYNGIVVSSYEGEVASNKALCITFPEDKSATNMNITLASTPNDQGEDSFNANASFQFFNDEGKLVDSKNIDLSSGYSGSLESDGYTFFSKEEFSKVVISYNEKSAFEITAVEFNVDATTGTLTATSADGLKPIDGESDGAYYTLATIGREGKDIELISIKNSDNTTTYIGKTTDGAEEAEEKEEIIHFILDLDHTSGEWNCVSYNTNDEITLTFQVTDNDGDSSSVQIPIEPTSATSDLRNISYINVPNPKEEFTFTIDDDFRKITIGSTSYTIDEHDITMGTYEHLVNKTFKLYSDINDYITITAYQAETNLTDPNVTSYTFSYTYTKGESTTDSQISFFMEFQTGDFVAYYKKFIADLSKYNDSASSSDSTAASVTAADLEAAILSSNASDPNNPLSLDLDQDPNQDTLVPQEPDQGQGQGQGEGHESAPEPEPEPEPENTAEHNSLLSNALQADNALSSTDVTASLLTDGSQQRVNNATPSQGQDTQAVQDASSANDKTSTESTTIDLLPSNSAAQQTQSIADTNNKQTRSTDLEAFFSSEEMPSFNILNEEVTTLSQELPQHTPPTDGIAATSSTAHTASTPDPYADYLSISNHNNCASFAERTAALSASADLEFTPTPQITQELEATLSPNLSLTQDNTDDGSALIQQVNDGNY